MSHQHLLLFLPYHYLSQTSSHFLKALNCPYYSCCCCRCRQWFYSFYSCYYWCIIRITFFKSTACKHELARFLKSIFSRMYKWTAFERCPDLFLTDFSLRKFNSKVESLFKHVNFFTRNISSHFVNTCCQKFKY